MAKLAKAYLDKATASSVIADLSPPGVTGYWIAELAEIEKEVAAELAAEAEAEKIAALEAEAAAILLLILPAKAAA